MSCSLCGDICRCAPALRCAEDADGARGEAPTFPAAPISTEVDNAALGSSAPTQNRLPTEQDSAEWRKEVSERLHRYHARRRPRAPRYPSLRLKFEPPPQSTWSSPARESAPAPAAQAAPQTSPVVRQAVAMDYPDVATRPVSFEAPKREIVEPMPELRIQEATAKIIEFPRPMYEPPSYLHALAEPMLDRPRILEAPEVLPPPPALGGMTIEAPVQAEPERRPGIDMPLPSAPAGRRAMAAAVDALLILVAVGLFGGVFLRMAQFSPSWSQWAIGAASICFVFWAAYQYLLMVHSGTTVGLRAMKLEMQRFDGDVPSKSQRRARVLCGMLSAVALGMGYAWYFLDEDGLCWHERVSKTHLAAKNPESAIDQRISD